MINWCWNQILFCSSKSKKSTNTQFGKRNKLLRKK